MAESVVIHESDLLIYKNQLLRYSEFLSEKSQEFRSILMDAKEVAFVDLQLCARLLILLEAAMPQFRKVDQAVSGDLQTIIQQTVNELDRADSFHYPESILDRIRALLSVFG
jgi:hypothetical protein